MKRFVRGFIIFDVLLVIAALAFSFWPSNLNERFVRGLTVPQSEGEADIGVVLGGGLALGGELSDVSKERVDHALSLHKERGIDFLFSGGETPRGIEGVAMNQYAKEQGYDGLDHVEASSRSTYENAFYSDQLLDEDRFTDDNVLVVTSPYHSRRALASFTQLMPERNILISYPETSVVLNDSLGGRWRGLYAIAREYAASAWYGLRFQIGIGNDGLQQARLSRPHDVLNIEMPDGTKLEADFYSGAEDKAVLLVHMLGQDRTSWDETLDLFLDKGWHVVVLDLRGHGKSSGNYKRFSEEDFKAMPGDIGTIANWLEENNGPLTLTVVGASIGANASLAAATEFESIDAVVALSAGLDYRGLDISAVPPKLTKPVLYAASAEDGYAFSSTQRLSEETATPQINKTFLQFDGAGHGTEMFKSNVNLANPLIDFIEGL